MRTFRGGDGFVRLGVLCELLYSTDAFVGVVVHVRGSGGAT